MKNRPWMPKEISRLRRNWHNGKSKEETQREEASDKLACQKRRRMRDEREACGEIGKRSSHIKVQIRTVIFRLNFKR